MSELAPDAELLAVLVRARDAARDALTAAECDLILQVCRDAAAMAPDLPGPWPALTARNGAELLLDLSVPQVDPDLRAELGRAVEAMVLRRRPKS